MPNFLELLNRQNSSSNESNLGFGPPPSLSNNETTLTDTRIQPRSILDFNASRFLDSNPGLSNQFKALGNELDEIAESRRNIFSGFDTVERALSQDQEALGDFKVNLGQDLLGQLNQEREVFNSQFGPEGEQTKRINDFFGGVGQFLANDQARQEAQIESDAIRSGASLGAQRAAVNEAANQNFKKFLEAKQREVDVYSNLYDRVNDYMTRFRQQYGDTTNEFIIGAYQDIANFRNTLADSLLKQNADLETDKLRFNLQQRGADLGLARDNQRTAFNASVNRGLAEFQSDLNFDDTVRRSQLGQVGQPIGSDGNSTGFSIPSGVQTGVNPFSTQSQNNQSTLSTSVSAQGLQDLANEEGFRSATYDDGFGNPTIGYGFTSAVIPGLQFGQTISQEDANVLLATRLESNYVKPFIAASNGNLTQGQIDALASLSWNAGPRHAINAVQFLNRGDIDGAAAYFRSVNTANGKFVQGLANRREREIVKLYQ